MTYWINVISRDHVMLGVEGGFTQADHGKNGRLKNLKKGDWVIFYSPKTNLTLEAQPVQAFTAIGQITDEQSYQVQLESGRAPWRRGMKFYDCTELPVRPLLDDLSFIIDKQHWGYPFHRGLFQITEQDFNLIKQAMSPKHPVK